MGVFQSLTPHLYDCTTNIVTNRSYPEAALAGKPQVINAGPRRLWAFVCHIYKMFGNNSAALDD